MEQLIVCSIDLSVFAALSELQCISVLPLEIQLSRGLASSRHIFIYLSQSDTVISNDVIFRDLS
jgi:hypothetical protein